MLVSFWKHHPVADQTGRDLARQTIAFQQRFSFDYAKLTPAGSWLAVCHGAEDAWRGDWLGRREILRPRITRPDDWYRLPDFRQAMPSLLSEQLLAAQLTRSAIVDAPVFATVFSPVSQAVQLAGVGGLLKHWQQHPEAVTAGLATLSRNLQIVLEEFRRLSVHGLYYVLQHARPGELPEPEHRVLSALADAPCLAEAARAFASVIIHLHGESVYCPLADLPDGTQLHFGAETPVGGFPQARLLPGMPTTVLANVSSLRTAVRAIQTYYPGHPEGGPDETHLMGECVLPLDFPAEQIQLWQQAVRQTVSLLH